MFSVLITALALSLTSPALAAPMDRPSMEDLRAHEDEILQRVRNFEPTRHQQLLELKQRDPLAYYAALRRLSRLSREVGDDPAAVARRMEMRRIEGDLRRMNDADPTAEKDRRAAATELVTRLFELRQEERRARIQQLRSALTELEAEVTERDTTRKALIDAYVDKVLTGPGDL